MPHKKALLMFSAGVAGLAGVALINGQGNQAQAATQTATVTYSAGTTTVWGTADYSQPKSYVSYQQTVSIYGSKQVGGTTWYLIGDNSWVPGMYLSLNNSSATTTKTTAVSQAPKQTTQSATATTATSTATTSTATTSAKAAAVINLAKQQLGKPYVWGAKGPDSFDCSGLMHYVFLNALNMEIGGWTVPQESAGTTISVSAAQPGDLLFWGSHGSTYHVALYLGNNQYLDAPTPGKTVEITSISQYFMPSFAVRVL